MKLRKQFEIIYRTHFQRLYEFGYRTLYDRDEALDCVHDVMTKLYAKLPEMEDDLGAYLTVAMRNELVERLRHMEIEQRHARWIAEDNDEAIESALQEMADSREKLDEINRVAKKEFSPAIFKVFDAVFRHGRSYADTASDFSISESTVNKHVVTALKILRNHFKNQKI